MRLSPANTKLQKTAKSFGLKKSQAWAFNMLAGWDCPYAKDCLSWVNYDPADEPHPRTLVDHPEAVFRCYGASMESRLPDVYNMHRENSDDVRALLKKGGVNALVDQLDAMIPPTAGLVRIHSDGGDFFNRHYFFAWMAVAALPHRKGCRFYSYTKALPLLVAYAATQEGSDLSRGILTPNVRCTASRGGSHDHLIDEYGMREAVVILRGSDATYEIDEDDTHAAHSGGSFNLLIHAAQPAGSPAMEAWEILRRAKIAENLVAKQLTILGA